MTKYRSQRALKLASTDIALLNSRYKCSKY